MDNFILSTERLVLRKMNRDDMESLLKIFADHEAMKYYPSTKNEKQTIDWIEWTINNYAKHGVGLWVVEDRVSGEFLGQCGIVPQEIDGIVEMEIGYLFVRRFWGNGYATEAALACKNYGFEQMRLRKMVSLIDISNLPSTNVAEKMGMKVEKTIHKWGKDVFVYSVSNQQEN